MKQLKSFITGALVMLLLTAAITAVFAAASPEFRPVTALFRGITVEIGGEELVPRNARGEIVEPIIDGTTYLPVRAISEALGKNVRWDGDSQTVFINDAGTRIERTISVTNLDELNAALAAGKGTEIKIQNDIRLADGETYNFTDVILNSDGGVFFVPKNSEVTVLGFSHVRPNNAPSGAETVQSGWGTWDLSLYLKGEDGSSWVRRPGETRVLGEQTIADEYRWWDTEGTNPHWCVPWAHDILYVTVNTLGQLNASLATVNGREVQITIASDISLADGAIYDFRGVTFVADGGVLVVPEDSEVVIVGTDIAWEELSAFVNGANENSCVFRPDMTDDETRCRHDSEWCCGHEDEPEEEIEEPQAANNQREVWTGGGDGIGVGNNSGGGGTDGGASHGGDCSCCG
jgi:hypothetical protein